MVYTSVFFTHHFFSGSKRKRASLENVNLMLERQKLDCSNGVDNPSSSVSGIASNFRRRLSSFSRLRGEKHSQIGELEATTPVIGTVTNNTGGDSTVELQGSSTLIAAKYRKRKRPFSWQRRREQKHVNFEEIDDMISCPPRLADNSSLSGGLECDVHEKVIPFVGPLMLVQLWFDILGFSLFIFYM